MEKIEFSDCPELINPNIKIKDVKRLIKNKTGIKEENQRFHVYFDYINFFYIKAMDNQSFWENFKLKVYDKTRYNNHFTQHYYDTNVILDLNKKIGELKQMVFEQTKIPMSRQQFYLNDEKEELDDGRTLETENLFQNRIIYKNKKGIK